MCVWTRKKYVNVKIKCPSHRQSYTVEERKVRRSYIIFDIFIGIEDKN